MTNPWQPDEFAGKVILVTGGSRGIGRAITLAFAELGGQVTFCYRSDRAAAEDTGRAAAARGWQTEPVQADVGRREEVETLVAQVLARHGKIDVLVNNAGQFIRRPVIDISDDEWASVIQSNLYSVFYCSRAVLPAMIKAGQGVIINMASMAGKRGSANHSHYAAAKGGVLAFTRSLAREVIQHNIRVNAVSPGRISTDMLLRYATDSERQRWQSDTPIRRMGTAEEIAAAVVFLASSASTYIVGETLEVNGGLLMD